MRTRWGFDGYVVSDCGAIADFHMHHGVTDTAEESAAMALNAGCDLNCGNIYLQVYKAVSEGLIEEKKVEEALEHLLMTRMRLGMFEACEYDSIPYETVECREHVALSRKAAARSLVLLKNNGILPLDKGRLKTVGVIGPNADSRDVLWGNYYGTSSGNTTLLEGIRQELGEQARVLYSAGCHLYKDTVMGGAHKNDRLKEALAVAERSDVVILCLGLDSHIEGEEGDANNEYAAGDKKTLRLPETQIALLEAVAGTGRPVVLCMMAGSAMDLRFAREHVDAILQVWYPGAYGGSAVAEVLFGKRSPSGKLPVTFYRSSEELPDFFDYSMKGRTYRYLEGEALYPFGYGLNYGDTYCRDAVLEKETEEALTFRIKVANDGKREASDVLQIYVKNLDSGLAVPNYSLCGMKRFTLQAGEEQELLLRVGKEALEVVDEGGNRIRDGVNYRFYVGCSQPDAVSVALTGRKPVEIFYHWES